MREYHMTGLHRYVTSTLLIYTIGKQRSTLSTFDTHDRVTEST